LVGDDLFTDCDLIINGNGDMNEQNNTCLPPPDGQGRWWALESPAPHLANSEQQQQQQEQGKKKKCRGNRKLQRYRRRHRSNGLNPTAIASSIKHIGGARQDNEQNNEMNEMETDVSTLPLDQVFHFLRNSRKSIC
jgi:hypothetical protein